MSHNDDKASASSTQSTYPTPSSSLSASYNTGLTLRPYSSHHSEDSYQYAELEGNGYLHTPTEGQIGGPTYEELDALPPPPRYEDVVSGDSREGLGMSGRGDTLEKGDGRGFGGSDGGGINNRSASPPRTSNRDTGAHQGQTRENTTAAAEEMGRLLSAALQFVRKENEQSGGGDSEQANSHHSISDAPTQNKEKKLGRCVAIPQHITPPSPSTKTQQHNRARRGAEERGSGVLQFSRAYSKALEPHSIDKPTFLDFIDGLNGLLSQPSLFSSAPASSSSTTPSTHPAVATISTPLISSYLEISNEVFFAPRGLKADIKTLPALLDTLLDQASPYSTGKKEVREIKKVGRDVEAAGTGEDRVKALFPWIRAVEWESQIQGRDGERAVEQEYGVVYGSSGSVGGGDAIQRTLLPDEKTGRHDATAAPPHPRPLHSTSDSDLDSLIESSSSDDDENPTLLPEKRKLLVDLKTRKRALHTAYRDQTQTLRTQGVKKKDGQWRDARLAFREEKKRLRVEKGEVRRDVKREKREKRGEKKEMKRERRMEGKEGKKMEGGRKDGDKVKEKNKGKGKGVDRKRGDDDGEAEGDRGGYWIVVQSLEGDDRDGEEGRDERKRKKKKSTEEIIWMVVQHSLGLGFF